MNLASVIKDAVTVLKPDAVTSSTELDFEISATLPRYVEGDGGRLRQILLNLVGNAVKFTKHGRVTVRVKPGSLPGHVYFEIIDSGCGITAENCTRLFEPFTQVDSTDQRQHGGTGLGLSISKRIAELMGGTIGVRSQIGVGSTFWFCVPLPPLPDIAPENTTTSPALPVPVSRVDGLRVLVVEDNPVNQRLAVKLIQNLGYSVEAASNGQQAVDMVLASDYAVVLMDCQMPVMDGFAATREIRSRERDRRTAIVALTARAMKEDEELCLAAGMDGYLSKPIDLARLAAKVHEWSVLRAGGASQASSSGTPERIVSA